MAASHLSPRHPSQNNHFIKFNNIDDLIDYLNQFDDEYRAAHNGTSNNPASDHAAGNHKPADDGSCGHDCCINGTCNCPFCFVVCPICDNDDDDDPAG